MTCDGKIHAMCLATGMSASCVRGLSIMTCDGKRGWQDTCHVPCHRQVSILHERSINYDM